MKLSRALSIPIALIADAVTLGNMGDRSFTQQVFDAERREKDLEALRALVVLVAALTRSKS